MSTTSSRVIQAQFSGDVTFNLIQSCLDNPVSPAEPTIVTLNPGDNTLTAPAVSGIVVAGVVIIPPAGNTNLLKFGQATGTNGIPMHKTDPSYIAVDTTFTTFVINAASTTVGIRIIWT